MTDRVRRRQPTLVEKVESHPDRILVVAALHLLAGQLDLDRRAHAK
jgi:hypothetical protein